MTLRAISFFVIEEYVEDVKHDEKDIPDLVESIMKALGFVKEEIRRIPYKIHQLRPKGMGTQKPYSSIGIPAPSIVKKRHGHGWECATGARGN